MYLYVAHTILTSANELVLFINFAPYKKCLNVVLPFKKNIVPTFSVWLILQVTNLLLSQQQKNKQLLLLALQSVLI